MNQVSDNLTVASSFTVDDVNRRLPLVKAIVQDIVALNADLVCRQERLSEICDRDEEQDSGGTPYDDEVLDMINGVTTDESRLSEFESELEALGGQLVDAVTGLVEFPSVIDDESGWLNWLPGEQKISYWRKESDARPIRRLLTGCSSSEE